MNKKIAIIYDWIDKWGGVERLLLTLHEIFPKADFFSSYYDPKNASWAQQINIKTSFIQQLPDFIKKNRKLSVPLYPFAFESFNFGVYDLVLSVTSSFAKGIITKPETKHICILLTPTRFLWIHQKEYKTNNLFIKPYINYLKKWDNIAAQRPDDYICISETVKKRLQLIYSRTGVVIYPPFDMEHWNKIKSLASKYALNDINAKYPMLNTKYYLVVSRLEPYKRIDLVIQSFNRLKDEHLVIVGEGSMFNQLKKMSDNNIFFVSHIPDDELAILYQNAQALIMPQEEDFGYVALEAQFFECPIIAYRKGGTVETIIENQTGIFFENQTVDSLTYALIQYDKIKKDLKKRTIILGKKQCELFSKEKFVSNLTNLLRRYE